VQINHPSIGEDYFATVGNFRAGTVKASVLLTGTEGAPDNYRLSFSEGVQDGNRTHPRHRHPFEQLRWVIEGEYVIGTDRVLPEGWVAWWDGAAWYGPQAKGSDLKVFELHYGSTSGGGYPSLRQRKEGYDKLLATGGRFEDGKYVWEDEKGKVHRRDAAEPVWEQSMGIEKVKYPEARYDSLIMMNPETFSWIKDPKADGVAYKNLGTFTERNVRLAFVHLDAGAVFQFGAEPAEEILIVKEGSVRHDGKMHGPLTAFGSAATDPVEELTATEPAVMFYVKLPTYSEDDVLEIPQDGGGS
jgi:hypothetical protein